jgi:hypothetical protein
MADAADTNEQFQYQYVFALLRVSFMPIEFIISSSKEHSFGLNVTSFSSSSFVSLSDSKSQPDNKNRTFSEKRKSV